MNMIEIIKQAVDKGASDIHIVPNRHPMTRIHGEVAGLEGFEMLNSKSSQTLVYSLLSEDQKKIFEENNELDCSYFIEGIGRFRVNVLMQKDGVGAVLRVITSQIPTAKDLNLGPIITNLAKIKRGLILVTGPTGSGKSTTLASLIDIINGERKDHILTIEDPIEYVFEQKECIVTQREVGNQTETFGAALKHALRQDPDVILLGELRDLETISAALTLAETGHVVFATLHTTDAPQTIDRIIDVFPPHQQQQVRMQLSITLKAVICQQLLLTKDRKSRIAAREIMIVNPAIGNLIREAKTAQIYSVIETGKSLGMITMDKSLFTLVTEGLINKEEAINMASNPANLRKLLG